VATLKKKKAEDIQNLTAEHLQYGGSTISDYLHQPSITYFSALILY
jgi:hypothetical protein